MNIYEIIWKQNGTWLRHCYFYYFIILIILLIIVAYLKRKQKIKKLQIFSLFMIYNIFWMILEITLLNRSFTVFQYELTPFWSWKEVLYNQNVELLKQIVLNCILLMPIGIMIPLLCNKRINVRFALMIGVIISTAIEFSQLIFMRGLFEWDDILHNSLGCMIGCWITNKVISCRKGE